METKDLVEHAVANTHGALGAAGALMWIRGSLPRKAAMLVLGTVASAYGTPDFAQWTGTNIGLAGFLVGMFSMTAADASFRAWDSFALGAILNEWVRRKLGLPEKGEKHD